MSTAAAVAGGDAGFAAGAVVEAYWEGAWYPATVRKVRASGSYDLSWPGPSSSPDDVIVQKRVPADCVRAPGASGGAPGADARPLPRQGSTASGDASPLSPGGAPRHLAASFRNNGSLRRAATGDAAPPPADAAEPAADAAEPAGAGDDAGTPAPTYVTKAEIAAACAAIAKPAGSAEYRGARWTADERVGAKFVPGGLQLQWVDGNGAAARWLDRDALGMELTHVDGAPVATLADLRREMGRKEEFRWLLAPCARPLPAAAAAAGRVAAAHADVVAVSDVGGKAHFACRVTRRHAAGDFGDAGRRYDVLRRYSAFDELRAALARAGCTVAAPFPEKTLTRCAGDALVRRRAALEVWLAAAVAAAARAPPAAAEELNRFLAPDAAAPAADPTTA